VKKAKKAMKLMQIMLRSIPVINRFRAMKVNVSYLKDTTEVCGRVRAQATHQSIIIQMC